MRTASAWIAALLLTGSALHFLGGNIADPDLWGHLYLGQMIASMLWSGDGFPRVDQLSYTAEGHPWYDHEWLTEVIFAGVYAVGGSAGLVLLKLLIGAALILLLLVTARALLRALFPSESIHPLTAALVLVPTLAVISPGATFRPQLFTMLLLALEGALLTRADLRFQSCTEKRVGWEIPSVPILLAIWANLHGGFVVGVGAFGLYGAAIVLRAARPARTPDGVLPVSKREALLVSAACLVGVLAPLANPYGIELYTYLFRTIEMHGQISEWHPVDIFSLEFLRFKLLVIVTAAAIGWLASQRRTSKAVWWALDWRAPFIALMIFYAFRHQRHTVLLGIVAAPLLIVAAEHARRLARSTWPALEGGAAVRATLAAGFCLVAAFQIGRWTLDLREHGLSIRFGRLDYPADAVEFLRTHGIQGNIAMPFEWGEYAIWKLSPQSRIFIDGRFETVYPEQVIDDYFAFMNGTPGWERLLDDYPTDVVVVQRWRDIHPRLFARPDLTYVYSDPAALVFVRRTQATNQALDRLASIADRHDFARPSIYFP